jgi:ABC-type nickel/cobalt efflux system permease component RcnA
MIQLQSKRLLMSNYFNNFAESLAPLMLTITTSISADQTHVILQDIAYIISICFAFYKFYTQHFKNKPKK